MTFDTHVAELFKDGLHSLDMRICAELGESHGRMVLHLRNHADTLTPDQCRKFWLAIVEEMKLPRFMEE